MKLLPAALALATVGFSHGQSGPSAPVLSQGRTAPGGDDDAVSDEAADRRHSGHDNIPMPQLRGSSLSSETTTVQMIFDLNHRAFTGEFTERFTVQWADEEGRLGPPNEVSDVKSRTVRSFNGVSTHTPGFRIRAVVRNALFIDQVDVWADGRVLNGLDFEEDNFEGFCFSTNTQGRFFRGRCFEDKTYECLDFCAGTQVRAVPNCDSLQTECPAPIHTPPPTNQLTPSPTPTSPPTLPPTSPPTTPPTPSPCFSNNDCRGDQYCDFFDSECRPKLDDGSLCRRQFQCREGLFCDLFSDIDSKCRHLRDDGSSCAFGFQCRSNSCGPWTRRCFSEAPPPPAPAGDVAAAARSSKNLRGNEGKGQEVAGA